MTEMNLSGDQKREAKFRRYFLMAAVAAAFTVFLVMIKVFIIPMVIAVVIAIMTRPIYKSMLKLTRNRQSLSSLICCFIVVIALLLPLVFIADQVAAQGIELYRGAGPQMEEFMRKAKSGAIGRVINAYAQKWFSINDVTVVLQPMLLSALDNISSAVPRIINKFSRTTAGIVFNSFVIVFSLFYFLRDGEKLIIRMKELMPVNKIHKERVIDGFYSMSNAIIKGIFLVALIQSILGTVTLWAFGVKGWLLWGLVMLVLSVIPFVGTGAVLIPAGIVKIIMGDTAQGIMIILISIFFISLIDNILRPRIIGQHAGMHDLLVFFSIIGGIFTFGPAGLIIGPLVAAIFLTMIEIYQVEFQSQIDGPVTAPVRRNENE